MKLDKNIALIGAGYWGKNHLRNLYNLGVIHSVVDKDSSNLKSLKTVFPNVNYMVDEEFVLNNNTIKAVIIAVPAENHYDVAKKCLLAGKDVLVEKPLAVKVSQAEELVNIAETKKRILMVGHILQYHGAVIKLKEIINCGELGEIQYMYSNRLNLGKLRIEENVLWSFAPHDISIILMLMNNQQPFNVKAFGESYITNGIYDITLTELEFSKNVKAHIFVSWLHPYKEQKLVVIGSKKMAVFDDVSEKKLFIYPYKVKYNNNIPTAQQAKFYSVNFTKTEPLKEELLHFIECIETRKQPKTDGREGLRVLKVIEKAEESLSNNLSC